MSTKDKWRKSFHKARSISQTSLDLKTQSLSSLLDESLEVSDDELQKYIGTLKERSGVGRLWTGNTFDRVIDRTPTVSISSVSDGELVMDAEENSVQNDDDFRPNLLQLPETSDQKNNSEMSEPSSIEPLDAVNMISDAELSEGPVQFNNLKFDISDKEVESLQMDVKSITNDLSKVEEVPTLDEISEVIEEDLGDDTSEYVISQNDVYSSQDSQKSEQKSHSQKSDSKRSQSKKQTYGSSDHSSEQGSTSHQKNDTRHSKHSSRHSSKHESRRSSRHRPSTTRKSNHKETPSRKSDYSYSTDFSESDNKKSDQSTSYDTSHSKTLTKSSRSRKKSSKIDHNRDNISHHDIGIQVNMDHGGNHRRLPTVGMTNLGPSYDNQNVDPRPIMPHLVSADVVEALTTYNPAILALTDMIRQQIRLVEQFVDNSKRMYESYTTNLNDTYKYTTLEDTMQYLHENDPRNFHRKSKKRNDEKDA